jgi:hypothetical protein
VNISKYPTPNIFGATYMQIHANIPSLPLTLPLTRGLELMYF